MPRRQLNAGARAYRRKLRFEALEDRRVLSAVVGLPPAEGSDTSDSEFTPRPPIVSNVTDVEVPGLTYNNFHLLTPLQIPLLSAAQIRSIPDIAWFGTLNDLQRGALLMWQVQELQVATVRLELLTATQRTWITTAQIQSLTYLDFKYLTTSQIPNLLPAQVGTIPDIGQFSLLSAAQRGALTMPQVQALNIATIQLQLLTTGQIAWLTQAQVQEVIVDEFYKLWPSQIPQLSLTQIAAADQPVTFRIQFTAAQKAALTQPQIQVMNVQNTRIDWMTPQQINWLTTSQIQQVILAEYRNLTPAQIPFLSLAQIAAADQPVTFRIEFTDQQSAALTQPQIQAINVSNTLIDWMTPQQISWLTPAQIAQVLMEEIPLLADDQIPLVSLAQFAQMAPGVLSGFSDQVKRNLTRAQLMAMPLDVLSGYMVVESTQYPPAGYIPAIHQHPDPNDPIGLPHAHDTTALEAFALLSPTDPARVYAVNNGNWSNPATWSNNAVPGLNAKVYIPQGKTVTFDTIMTQPVKVVRVDGTLTFAPNVNTTLRADTIIVYTTGTLHIGTQAAPIADNVTAKILIPSGAVFDKVWDPNLVSRGLISRGSVRMFGRYVTPYASLAVDPIVGATTLTFTQAPVGWRVGDELVIAGTNYPIADFGSERVTITAINGAQVTLNQPLTYAHDAPDGMGFTVQVANTNRNIQFIGEGDPTNQYVVANNRTKIQERPHMMFIDNPDVQVENILVQGFGRTDKDIRINAPVVINGVLVPGTGLNTRARYSIHFHHTGVNPANAPAIARNNVVVGSPGWGLVNHQSNVVMEHNVSIESVGAGFVAEDGNEIGVMRGNLAMMGYGADSHEHPLARRDIHDFGHSGHGFWLQSPGIDIVDNIAVNMRGAAYAYQTSSSVAMFDTVNLPNPAIAEGRLAVPVGVAPLKGFRGNTAYAVDQGLEMWFHQTNLNEGASEVVDFKVWGAKQAGIQLFYVSHLKIRDSVLMGRFDIVTNNTGVNSNRITQDIVFDNLHIEGFDVGLVAPTRRSTVIEGGLFNNVRNLLIGKGGDTIRSLDVTEPITFVTPTPAQLAGRTPLDVSVTQAWYITENVGRKSESLFSADDLRMKLSNGTTLRLYYADQAATAKPFPTVQSIVDFNSQWVNKTNLELSQNYGLWFNGGGLPAGAFTPSGFVGLAVVETAAFPTDFDGNNRVDGGDFLAWQRGHGVPAAVQANGDANGDREVDELDLDLWADDFGAQGAFSAASGAAAALTAPTSDPVIPITPDLADAAMAYVQMTEEMEEAPAKTSKWRRFRPWF